MTRSCGVESKIKDKDKNLKNKKFDLPKYDAVRHCFKQSFSVGVDGQDVFTVRILLQRRVDVVGEGKALLL